MGGGIREILGLTPRRLQQVGTFDWLRGTYGAHATSENSLKVIWDKHACIIVIRDDSDIIASPA